MTNISAPEGFVFVRSGLGVAAELLAAADKLEVDRQAGIRSITGGYHVRENIAEEWQKGYAIEESDEDTDDASDDNETGSADSGDASGDAETGSEDKSEGSDDADDDEPTLESKREEIDDYASKLTPSLDTTKLPNKQAALDAIADHKAQASA